MGTDYAFRVTGRLTPGLLGALDPLWPTAVTTETLLVGTVADRAALHGLIARIEALGLELVGLQQLARHPTETGCGHCRTSCGEAGGRGDTDAPHVEAPSRW